MIPKPDMIVMPAHATNTWPRYGAKFEFIVLHYVGAVSTARNNGTYYGTTPNIRASAHFFVDEREIVSSVPLTLTAGHCGVDYSGGRAPFWSPTTNRRSIGIEMCCKKTKDGQWYIEPETVTRTVGLVRWLMQEYGIPVDRVIRHYDVCWKNCPAPWVEHPAQWENFKKRLMEEEEETEVRYNTVSEMPAHYRDGANRLVERGALRGRADGSLDVSEDMIRTMLVCQRMVDEAMDA